MVGTLTSFTTMAIGARELSADLNTTQILFYRSAVALVIVCALLQISGWQQIRTRFLSAHVIRNVAHFGGQYGWFYGIAFIPLAEVVSIEFTVPVWTALLAVIFLGERLTIPRVLAIGLGVTGLLVILRPGLEVIHPAALAVLASAFCYGVTYIQTRKVAGEDSPLCVLFYMIVVQIPIATGLVLTDWTVPQLHSLPWILVVALGALGGHYCITRAVKLVDATVVAPMDFLRVPFIAAIGFLMYGEKLDWFVLAGAVIMFGGNYISIRAEKRRLS
jgi:drug/metabolite transporter (DMT)-like permease